MSAALIIATSEVAATRFLLASVCAVSAGMSFRMGYTAGALYRPHLFLIAGWSAVFSLGMLALAVGWALPLVLGALNAAAAMTIGGWAILVARLVRGGSHE